MRGRVHCADGDLPTAGELAASGVQTEPAGGGASGAAEPHTPAPQPTVVVGPGLPPLP